MRADQNSSHSTDGGAGSLSSVVPAVGVALATCRAHWRRARHGGRCRGWCRRGSVSLALRGVAEVGGDAALEPGVVGRRVEAVLPPAMMGTSNPPHSKQLPQFVLTLMPADGFASLCAGFGQRTLIQPLLSGVPGSDLSPAHLLYASTIEAPSTMALRSWSSWLEPPAAVEVEIFEGLGACAERRDRSFFTRRLSG